MEPAEVVLRFLASVGQADEAEFYLRIFRAEARERFALIHVDVNVARQAADAVVLELGFLASLGLTPAVTFGLFHAGESLEHTATFRRRLELAGVPSQVVTGDGASVAEIASRGVIPLVALPETEGGEDRLARFGALVASLASRKIVFLTRAGGFKVRGALVPLVNLSTEADTLAGSRDLSRKELAILAAARRLALAPHKLTISVTSPLDLLRELFTVKGAGTLLRRGAVVQRRRGLEGVDRERLDALLASSFGRSPAESFYAQDISDVYVEEGYRGAAVLARTPLGPYLTKFAVEREAQGEGLGRDLWQSLTADHPRFFWRARAQNPINAWYTKVCDGLTRFADWHVFWRGVAPEEIAEVVAFVRAQPKDFA